MKTKYITTIIFFLSLIYPAKAGVVWTEGHHEINDGDIYGEIWMSNDCSLNIYGGEIYQLGTFNNTITNWYDGQMDYLLTNDNSIINIYGGKLNNLLVIYENSMINLYANNVSYNDITRIIEGNYYYGDHSHFLIELSPRPDAFSHVTIIPEPATILILGLGGLVILRRKKL